MKNATAIKDPCIKVDTGYVYLLASAMKRGLVEAVDGAEQCEDCGEEIPGFSSRARVVGSDVVCGCGRHYRIQTS